MVLQKCTESEGEGFDFFCGEWVMLGIKPGPCHMLKVHCYPSPKNFNPHECMDAQKKTIPANGWDISRSDCS